MPKEGSSRFIEICVWYPRLLLFLIFIFTHTCQAFTSSSLFTLYLSTLKWINFHMESYCIVHVFICACIAWHLLFIQKCTPFINYFSSKLLINHITSEIVLHCACMAWDSSLTTLYINLENIGFESSLPRLVPIEIFRDVICGIGLICGMVNGGGHHQA